jgi:hypothetical protein
MNALVLEAHEDGPSRVVPANLQTQQYPAVSVMRRTRVNRRPCGDGIIYLYLSSPMTLLSMGGCKASARCAVTVPRAQAFQPCEQLRIPAGPLDANTDEEICGVPCAWFYWP